MPPPTPHAYSRRTLILVTAGVAAAVLLARWLNPAPAPAPGRPRPTAETQEERRRAIKTLTARGVFRRITTADEFPDAWVGPTFYDLDFEDKERAARLVWYYHCEIPALEGRDRTVTLRDDRTGKTVGRFHPQSGLVID